MKSQFITGTVIAVTLVIATAFARIHYSHSRDVAARETETITTQIPPLPPGVTELKFNEFFVMPIGPRGVVFTDKLSKLDGKRVRMLGFMVRQEHGVPGQFLFSALPVQLHDHDAAFADDLPPATVHVTVPTCLDREVPYSPGLMLLTGTLTLGPREEADGRSSLVRLALDAPARNEQNNLVLSKHFTHVR